MAHERDRPRQMAAKSHSGRCHHDPCCLHIVAKTHERHDYTPDLPAHDIAH
jgi:hypothetical protein